MDNFNDIFLSFEPELNIWTSNNLLKNTIDFELQFDIFRYLVIPYLVTIAILYLDDPIFFSL